jgi:hypothetical protein
MTHIGEVRMKLSRENFMLDLNFKANIVFLISTTKASNSGLASIDLWTLETKLYKLFLEGCDNTLFKENSNHDIDSFSIQKHYLIHTELM